MNHSDTNSNPPAPDEDRDLSTDFGQAGKKYGAAPLPLFYTKPTPLDAKAHANLGLLPDFGLNFTAGVNSVPINMIEMPQICHYYPIAFSSAENAQPVAILGLRNNENLFLNHEDAWEPRTYIPAYIRRYPFIFSKTLGGDQLTLCIDLDDSVVGDNCEQTLFDEDGKPSAIAQNALEFCKSYHAAAMQTNEFSKALRQSGLLVDRHAEIETKTGKKISFSGFRIIDEQRLAELDDEIFISWRKKGWLPFVYAQLFSGVQWQRLKKLLNSRL